MLRILKQYYPARNAVFVVGEGLAIYFSVLFASAVFLGLDWLTFKHLVSRKAVLIALVCQTCLYYNDLYDLNITNTLSELTIRLLQALGVAAIILSGVYFLFPQAIIAKGVFVVSIIFVICLMAIWRFLYTLVLDKGWFNQKIIFIGSGKLVRNIIGEIKEKKDSGYEIVGVLQNSSCPPEKSDLQAEVICSHNYQGLSDLVKERGVKKVVVALEEKRGALPINELLKCRVEGIDVLDGNSFYEMLTGKLVVEHMNPGWLVFSEGFKRSRWRWLLKRCGDIFLSLLMLILLMPLIVLVAIIIKIDSPGPVFFSQERTGERKKKYKIYKFRSMVANAEAQSGPVWAQSNDSRVTKFGHFIRLTRIDEIPQLWNVLRGEMSFVGPRPEREFFIKKLEELIPYYGERFSAKPGLTGWAQVCYPYGASVEDAVEKLNYDLFYIKNMSFLMDMMIVMRTVKTVLFAKGAR